MGIYKNFTCVKDVLIYLEICEEEQKKVFNKLDNIKIGLFDPNRKELKQEREELKKQLRVIKFRIKNCVGILEENTTFSSTIFLKFLTRYLTLREGVEYVVMNISEDDVALGIATKTYGCMSTEYKVVTTVNNKNMLERKGNQGTFGATTDDINEYFRACKDKKYICFSDEKRRYSLLDGASLSEGFERYPYLRDLAFELVDLKLQNPNMSDIERLNMVLNKLQKKKAYPHN